MGTCKGNRGNLLQHWVFCETLHAIREAWRQEHKHSTSDPRLLLVTTHSMAPWSVPGNGGDDVFNLARTQLNGGTSRFEQVWYSLSHGGLPYPSSAAIAVHEWGRKRLSLIQCEVEEHVQQEISGWLSLPEVSDQVMPSRLHAGDWRTFQLSDGDELKERDVVFVELDPYRVSQTNRPGKVGERWNDVKQQGNFYADDFVQLREMCEQIPKACRLVVQLSSYAVEHKEHALCMLSRFVSERMDSFGLRLVAVVPADMRMVSWVFTRDLSLWQGPTDLAADLPEHFRPMNAVPGLAEHLLTCSEAP